MSTPLTAQKCLNKTWQYHVVEKNPYGFDGFQCVYWDSQGRRCGIGCALNAKDAENIQKEYGTIISRVYEALPNLFEKLDLPILSEIQSAHDECARHRVDINGYKDRLIAIAQEHRLTIPT